MADWTKQADQLLKSWAEAQKNVWDSWQDLAAQNVGVSAKPQALGMNPMEWFQRSMATFTDPGGVARGAGQQVFGSQFTMMRNLEMLTKAWQLIAPQVDAGQDWRSTLNDFSNSWFGQLSGTPQGMVGMAQDTQALWQSYMNEWGPLLKPWMSSALEATGSGHLGEMMLGGTSGMSRLLMMGQDEFQGAPFGNLAELPSVGVTREHQAKVLRAFDAFVDMRKAMLAFNELTIGGLNKAMETVIETLIKKGKEGEKIESVRDLNRLWLDSADKVFTDMYASEDYLVAQRELSNTGMTYKIMQRDVIEMVLKGLDLPTRSELDDAYKTLYMLRKEVKALKKALHGQAKPAQQAQAATQKSTRPKATTKQSTQPKAPTQKSTRPKATTKKRTRPKTTAKKRTQPKTMVKKRTQHPAEKKPTIRKKTAARAKTNR